MTSTSTEPPSTSWNSTRCAIASLLPSAFAPALLWVGPGQAFGAALQASNAPDPDAHDIAAGSEPGAVRLNVSEVTPPSWRTFDMLHPAAHGHVVAVSVSRHVSRELRADSRVYHGRN